MWPPRTIVITDPRVLAARGDSDQEARLVAFVGASAAAGVDAVQVRAQEWADARLLRVTRAAMAAVQGSRCRVLVNERTHVAMSAGAHGVHLRGNGMPAARVRRASPAGWLIGRSVHVGDDVAVAAGVDVALFGTVFPSRSKGYGAPVAGLPALARWAAQPGAPPVAAVGGIDLERCESVHEAGATGVAGIDVFARAWLRGAPSLASLVRDIHAVFRDRERAE